MSILPKAIQQRFIHILFVIALTSFFLFLRSSQVLAVASPIYSDSPPPASYSLCAESECVKGGSNPPSFCWNSQSAGVTDCGAACEGGDPWTKYAYKGCYKKDAFSQCGSYYQSQEAVCSTADKCTSTSNNPYLNAGRCDCTVLGIYKTCCTNTTPSVVSSNSCVQIAVDTTNPPYEGVCPGGTHPVQCGFGSNPPCGQEACGPLPPAGPTCGNGICESGENSDNCRQDCSPPAPNLTSFSGVSSNNSTSCFLVPYTASLSWSGTALPASDSSCPNGYWVDIDTDSAFSGGFYHKCTTATSTSAPAGFGGFNGTTGSLTFQKGLIYYARIFNGTHSNTISLTVPNQDCPASEQPPLSPSCQNFNLSAQIVEQGKPVTISTQISDNTLVDRIELHKNTSQIGPTFTNSLGSNPFSISYNFDTAQTPPGTYTISANAYDIFQNLMLGTSNICNKALEITTPSCPSPPTNLLPQGQINICSPNQAITLSWSAPGATFYNVRVDGVGAKLAEGKPSGVTDCNGHAICVDNWPKNTIVIFVNPNQNYLFWVHAGAPSCNLTNATSASFSTTCQTQDSISVTDPLTRLSSSQSWPQPIINVSITTTPQGHVFYKQGSGINPGPCTSGSNLCSGWAQVKQNVATGSFNDWTPASTITDNIYTFGLFDQNINRLLATDTTTFYTGSSPPPPTGGGGGSGGGGTGCNLGPDTLGSQVRWLVSTQTPTGNPTNANLQVNSQVQAIPGSSSSWTCSTDPETQIRTCFARSDYVTYTPNTRLTANYADGAGNSCSGSTTVGAPVVAGCNSNFRDSFSLTVNTKNDPGFDIGNWPQFNWITNNSDICWATEEPTADVQSEGVSFSRPIASQQPKSLFDSIKDLINKLRTHLPPSIKVLAQTGKTCFRQNDCNDNNSCTFDECLNDDFEPVRPGDPPGRCHITPGNNFAKVCATSPNGGNMYCTAAGICSDTPCQKSDDCGDGNACTKDSCLIPPGEAMGSCANINLPPTTICEKVSNNPTKLCSVGSNPGILPDDPSFVPSKCSVDYVKCDSISLNSTTTNACCGQTNIQGAFCQGSCNQVFNSFNDKMTPLANVRVHVENSRCANLSRSALTNDQGSADFNTLPWDTNRSFYYKVWAEMPQNYTFTRGQYLQRQSFTPFNFVSVGVIPPPSQPIFEKVEPRAPSSSIGAIVDFGFQKTFSAWIQTFGGDVHSNKRIFTHGGPQ